MSTQKPLVSVAQDVSSFHIKTLESRTLDRD